MGVKGFYEEMYGDRAGKRPGPPFLYRKLKRFELTRYELAYRLAPGGKSALDVGCGDGELLFRLRDKYQAVWGIDIAPSRIERIKKNIGGKPGIHVSTGDANEQLNFDDGFFDAIVAIALLEHIFNPYHFVKECHRLLRAGGTLIVQVPNVVWLPNRLRVLGGKLPVTSDEIGWDGGHLHYFNRDSLKKLCLDGGFGVVKITSGGIFAGCRRMWGALLGPDIFVVAVKK